VTLNEKFLKFQRNLMPACSRVNQFKKVQEDSSWTPGSEDKRSTFFEMSGPTHTATCDIPAVEKFQYSISCTCQTNLTVSQ
jgi:hypothetical protein